MPNQKLGVTANELFACNPFRILGLPVTAEDEVISSTYKKLLSIAGTAEADNYKTDYDFPALPPFRRDELTLKTAYAKLASNGYRCFAFSSGEFSQSLNIDDVLLNIYDITGYDCFLRCYMWLIVNDRTFEEPELWVPLAEYIDKMIYADPSKWGAYFDSRFPQSALAKDGESLLAEFHATFKDIILLPIKELVRGSMRCTTAIQILEAAKVDVHEEFPRIDIPQANKAAPGMPQPKLKIAAKDDEYFDLSQGKMVESNTFAAAASAISADAILGAEAPKPAPRPAPVQAAQPVQPVQPAAPKEERKVSLVDDHIAAQAAANTAQNASRVSMVEEEVPVKHVEAIDGLAPRVRPKTAAQPKPQEPAGLSFESKPSAPSGQGVGFDLPSENTAGKLTINASPDEYTKDKNKPKEAAVPVYYTSPPANDLPSANVGSRSLEAIDPFASAGGKSSSGPAVVESYATTGATKRKQVSLTGLDGLEGGADSGDTLVQMQFTQPTGARKQEPVQLVEETVENQKNITERKTLTSIIEDVESKTEESGTQLLAEQEIEDELYTDTLIKLLRSNRSNKMMMEVDTEHVFINGGGNEGSAKVSNITMDEINPNKIDTSSLDSAYDGTRRINESDPNAAARAIKAKYKNINIDDMINPTVGGTLNKEYHEDAIKKYVKEKQAEKKLYGSIGKFVLFAIFVAALIGFLWYMTSG